MAFLGGPGKWVQKARFGSIISRGIQRMDNLHNQDFEEQAGISLNVPPEVVRRAVNRMILHALPEAALFLAGYYAFLAIIRPFLLGPPLAIPLSVLAGVSCLLLLLLYGWLRGRSIAHHRVNLIGATIGGIGLANIFIHTYLAGDLLETSNLTLAIILIGLMLPADSWFIGMLTVTISAWVVTAWLLRPSDVWVHVAFSLALALPVSVLARGLLFRAFRHNEKLRQQSERLLLNILPELVAERLKRYNEPVIADEFTEVTVLFADIVGFTPLAANMSPREVVMLLNRVFSALDQLADHYGLEKIKTIGDAYMAVGGLPEPRSDHAEAVAEMALQIRDTLKQIVPESQQVHMRVGIHTGPVIAGVIGIRKFSYDLWGDTVNTASRMEAHGLPERIQVSAQAYARLREHYRFEERGQISIKGKGEMQTYFLVGKR
jgi:class 3 adenylate cyclase